MTLFGFDLFYTEKHRSPYPWTDLWFLPVVPLALFFALLTLSAVLLSVYFRNAARNRLAFGILGGRTGWLVPLFVSLLTWGGLCTRSEETRKALYFFMFTAFLTIVQFLVHFVIFSDFFERKNNPWSPHSRSHAGFGRGGGGGRSGGGGGGGFSGGGGGFGGGGASGGW